MGICIAFPLGFSPDDLVDVLPTSGTHDESVMLARLECVTVAMACSQLYIKKVFLNDKCKLSSNLVLCPSSIRPGCD